MILIIIISNYDNMSIKRTHSDDQVIMTDDCHSSKRIKFSNNDYLTMTDDTTTSEVYDKLLSFLKKNGINSEYRHITGLNDVSDYVVSHRPSVIDLHVCDNGYNVHIYCR